MKTFILKYILFILIVLLLSVQGLFGQKELRISLSEKHSGETLFLKITDKETSVILLAELVVLDQYYTLTSQDDENQELIVSLFSLEPIYVPFTEDVSWQKDTSLVLELGFTEEYSVISRNLSNYLSIRGNYSEMGQIFLDLYRSYPIETSDTFKIYKKKLRDYFDGISEADNLYVQIDNSQYSITDVELSQSLFSKGKILDNEFEDLYNLYKDLDSKISSLNYLPPLPYPPPSASSRYLLESNEFGNVQIYGDIDSLLSKVLMECGYSDKSYYAVPGGFAIVTQIEQIQDDGATIDGEERWSEIPSFNRGKSLIDYVIRLIGSNQGRFRMFIFWISNEPIYQSDRLYNEADLIILPKSGTNFLPIDYKKVNVPDGTSCTVLAYEFIKKELDGNMEFIDNSSVSCYSQLVKLGFIDGL